VENVEIGDIVGWRISLYNDGNDNAECYGEVIAIHGDILCLRSIHVTLPNLNPFHGRSKSLCHMIKKAGYVSG
jgi:hypothetical protein